MTNDTCKYLHKDALAALASGRLLQALETLGGMASMLGAWSAKEEIDQLSASCHMLLSYLAKGADDPARETMYRSFVRRAYELSDLLARQYLLADGEAFYTQSLRTLEQIVGTNDLLDAQLRRATDLRNLFDLLWLSGQLTRDDETEVANLLADPSRSAEAKLLAVSALTLSSMQFFDIAKCRLLLDNVLTDDVPLRARALVGLVFVLLFHADRLALYSEELDRLRMLLQVSDFRQELECLQTLLFVSLDSKQVERNLQDDIIPGIKEQMSRMKDEILQTDDAPSSDTELPTFNPEWLNDESMEQISRFAERLADLRKRGADMYLGAFRSFKGRFPFFRHVRNWFWPFTFNHPELTQGVKVTGITKAALRDQQLCDSDKYSFYFLASQAQAMPLPEALSKALDEHYAEAEAAQPDFSECLRSYVQDFYRFSHLFGNSGSFPNPFKRNLLLADCDPFASLLDDVAYCRRMGDFVFNDKNYGMALRYYQAVPEGDRSAYLWQKIGFCHEQQDNEESAALARSCYLRANALETALWTLRRLARLDMVQGRYGEALEWFEEMEKSEPDNVKTLLGKAECLMRTSQYDEAFKSLFKANYLAPESMSVVRALAWCSVLSGKYEQAEKYYAKILAAEPTKTDFLNAGHAAWLLGRIADAVGRYLRAVTAETVHSFLDNDRELLLRAGLSATSLSLMAEAVALRFSEPNTQL